MTSILVVCTGNICRSPIAEGLLRDALRARLGARAPSVSSAGLVAVEGAGATAEAVEAAAERGTDIGGHRARRFSSVRQEGPDLVIGMAAEHREAAFGIPGAADRAFTLKELVRALETLPPAPSDADPEDLATRVAQAAEARRGGFTGNPLDEDIVDPLGMPFQSYQAVAWELDEWIARLVVGLYGAAPMSAASEA
jgi:protein-tyrosine phosphatase